MPDHAHLDERYFVDQYVYNCPFCNRRNVSYSIYDHVSFHWTENKKCHVYFVRCGSCKNNSMHLSYVQFGMYQIEAGHRRFNFDSNVDAGAILDKAFFYSVPTSFFVLDERIPAVLRELLTEAEGCLKSNFLTGASACARKIVYELAVLEKASGENYEDRIKSLKKIHSEIDPMFFDTLLTIQQVTSSKVHENSYDGWESRHLRVILASLLEVLRELYVAPAIREDRRKAILSLKEEVLGEVGAKPKKAQDQREK